MVMKNKLLHHHKSKFSIFMRNFSFTIVGLFLVAGALSVPTYISITSSNQKQMQASEIENRHDDENKDDEDLETVSNDIEDQE